MLTTSFSVIFKKAVCPVSFKPSYLLRRSGFSHSAYTFAHECSLGGDAFEPGEVPPGALIHIIQKGLQFIEMEANISRVHFITPSPLDVYAQQEGTPITAEYSFINSRDLITKDVDELRRDIRSRKRETPPGEASDDPDTRRVRRSMEMEGEEIDSSKVMTMRQHTAEVFTCAWHPTEDILATGSGDATAMIWRLEVTESGIPSFLVLRSGEADEDVSSKTKEITAVAWSPLGDRLATGSYDGTAVIWSNEGTMMSTCAGHEGTIFSLKWNRRGSCLLTGGADERTNVWNADGTLLQTFAHHSASVIDVDWMDDVTFASCSTDSVIYVCQLNHDDEPLKTFTGHTADVNAVEWDPNGHLLASCSDDTTARIWNLDRECPLAVLEGHRKGIFSVRWRPIDPNLLATASLDTTVKLWDITSCQCRSSLEAHEASIYTAAFSPYGQLLVSGSLDGCLCIWNVADGKLVKRWTGSGCINEVCWNGTGTYIAACCNDRSVIVLDMRC